MSIDKISREKTLIYVCFSTAEMFVNIPKAFAKTARPFSIRKRWWLCAIGCHYRVKFCPWIEITIKWSKIINYDTCTGFDEPTLPKTLKWQKKNINFTKPMNLSLDGHSYFLLHYIPLEWEEEKMCISKTNCVLEFLCSLNKCGMWRWQATILEKGCKQRRAE